jgi:hypothetical protein
LQAGVGHRLAGGGEEFVVFVSEVVHWAIL